jgi:hypothetical protein
MSRGVASLEGDKWIVFYYLSASEIWPDEMVAFDGSGLIRGVAFGGSSRRINRENLSFAVWAIRPPLLWGHIFTAERVAL